MIFVSGAEGRFSLEPRCDRFGRYTWLVAYDTVKKTYVKTKRSTREYAKWSNSMEAFKELEKRIEEGEL